MTYAILIILVVVLIGQDLFLVYVLMQERDAHAHMQNEYVDKIGMLDQQLTDAHASLELVLAGPIPIQSDSKEVQTLRQQLTDAHVSLEMLLANNPSPKEGQS